MALVWELGKSGFKSLCYQLPAMDDHWCHPLGDSLSVI